MRCLTNENYLEVVMSKGDAELETHKRFCTRMDRGPPEKRNEKATDAREVHRTLAFCYSSQSFLTMRFRVSPFLLAQVFIQATRSVARLHTASFYAHPVSFIAL